MTNAFHNFQPYSEMRFFFSTNNLKPKDIYFAIMYDKE